MAAEKNKSLEDVNMRPEKKTLSTAKTNGDPGLIKAATVESNVVHKQS